MAKTFSVITCKQCGKKFGTYADLTFCNKSCAGKHIHEDIGHIFKFKRNGRYAKPTLQELKDMLGNRK